MGLDEITLAKSGESGKKTAKDRAVHESASRNVSQEEEPIEGISERW